MYSYGPPHIAKQKQDDQHDHTFSNYVRIRDVVQKTCQRRWTIGKSGARGSGISELPARHDDDDLYVFRQVWTFLRWIPTFYSVFCTFHIIFKIIVYSFLFLYILWEIFTGNEIQNEFRSVWYAVSLIDVYGKQNLVCNFPHKWIWKLLILLLSSSSLYISRESMRSQGFQAGVVSLKLGDPQSSPCLSIFSHIRTVTIIHWTFAYRASAVEN